MNYIILELTFIIKKIRDGQFTFSYSQSFAKHSFVFNLTFIEIINSISFRFTLEKITLKIISIWESLFSLTMFQKIYEIALIFLSISSCMDPISLNFSIDPLTNILIAIKIFPNSISIFLAVFPFTRIFI